MRTRVQQ